MNKLLINTPVDLFGETVLLDRYERESLGSYVNRLRDFYAFNPNTSYEGLCWAATKELALNWIPYGEIETTVPSSYAEVSPSGIVLTNDYETIEYSFFSFDPSGNVIVRESFDGFSDAIAASDTFSFTQHIHLVDPISPMLRTELFDIPLYPLNLLFSNNIAVSSQVFIPTDVSFFGFPNGALVQDSLSILEDGYENLSFENKKNSVLELEEQGDYYVDYYSGTIQCYRRLDLTTATASYKYYRWPFLLTFTPIQIIPWLGEEHKHVFYNVYGQADYSKIPFPVVTDIIEDLRSENVSY